jgi:TRAP-type C4-dicarboxylate transport system permease small subunit
MLCRWLSRWLGRTLVALLAALAVVATLDLGAWLLWSRSWAEVEEFQGILMIWFGLLGAAYALAEGLHLSLDLVVARLPAAWRRGALRFAAGAVTLFGVLVAVYALRLARAVSNTLPATGWSAAMQYVPAVVAGALVALIGVEQTIAPRDESGAPPAGLPEGVLADGADE